MFGIGRVSDSIRDFSNNHKILVVLAFLLTIAYGVGFYFRYDIEMYFTFPWAHLNTLDYTQPEKEKIDLDFERVSLSLSGGWKVNGLFIDNGSDTTVFYFHGNGGSLEYFYSEIQYISNLWYNVMSYDYPGYWESTGIPDKYRVVRYADFFYESLRRKKNLSDRNTIVWGYSIGTGVGLEWGKRKNMKGYVLEAPYLSTYDLSRDRFFVSLQKIFFVPNSFESYSNIQQTSSPVLLIHGTEDQRISVEQSHKLSSLWKEGKTFFIENEGGNHYDILEREVIGDYIQEFVETGKLPFDYKLVTDGVASEWKKKMTLVASILKVTIL